MFLWEVECMASEWTVSSEHQGIINLIQEEVASKVKQW